MKTYFKTDCQFADGLVAKELSRKTFSAQYAQLKHVTLSFVSLLSLSNVNYSSLVSSLSSLRKQSNFIFSATTLVWREKSESGSGLCFEVTLRKIMLFTLHTYKLCRSIIANFTVENRTCKADT